MVCCKVCKHILAYGATSNRAALVLLLQLSNDIAKAKADIQAAELRQQELLQLVQQAKQGKEDSVRDLAGGRGVEVSYTRHAGRPFLSCQTLTIC